MNQGHCVELNVPEENKAPRGPAEAEAQHCPLLQKRTARLGRRRKKLRELLGRDKCCKSSTWRTTKDRLSLPDGESRLLLVII